MMLYHYTNAESLRKIITTKTLRLTHYAFLNDETEVHEGFKYVCQLFLFALNKQKNDENSDISDRYIKLIEGISKFFDEDFTDALSPIYVTSFSKHGDMLSQWRAYGSYCIAFERDEINKSMEDLEKSTGYKTSVLDDCVYAEHEKYERVRSFLKEMITFAETSFADDAGKIDNNELQITLVHKLILTACFLKNLGFKEESEVRGVMSSGVIQYTTKSGLLIPYVTLPIELSAIKKITVGPQKEKNLACKALRSFLDYIKARENQHEFEIEVEPSVIPFRDI